MTTGLRRLQGDKQVNKLARRENAENGQTADALQKVFWKEKRGKKGESSCPAPWT